MRTGVVRKFNRVDAIVMVAATAAGLGLAPITHQHHVKQKWSVSPHELTTDSVRFVALAWTISVLVLRFLPPRPRRQRLWRQPGLVASTAAVAGGILNAGVQLIWTVSTPPNSRFQVWDPLYYMHFVALPNPLASAVVVAWVILLVSRRWRAERSWSDRLGRALGVFWIVWAGLEHTHSHWFWLSD